MKKHKYKTSTELSDMGKEIWEGFAEQKLTPFERTIIINQLKEQDALMNNIKAQEFMQRKTQPPHPTFTETPKSSTMTGSIN